MNSKITSYPLSWPAGWRRTQSGERINGHFGRNETKYSSPDFNGKVSSWNRKRSLTVADAVERVMKEMSMMGISDDDFVISTNIQTRLDGLPRSDRAEPSDSGTAVYWRKGEQTRCMAIDQYTRAADNLAAIAATLEALRAIARHGSAETLERAFVGFAALPPPDNSWWSVLQFDNRDQALRLGKGAVEARFREQVKFVHPDAGGSAEQFQKLTSAKEQALAELSGNIQ